MSYIKDLEASVLRDRISHIEKDQFINACKDLQEVMGMNVPYDSNDTLDNQCEWVTSAVQAINADDDFALTTWAVLKKLGYEIPEKEPDDPQSQVEADNGGQDTQQEAAKVPAEAEVKQQDPTASSGPDKEPVKIRKAKKEPESVKESKALKEPKAKKESKEKKPRGVGVIAFLRDYVKKNGEKGFTMEDIHAKACEAFPDRAPDKLLATCRAQLSNARMGSECGLVFHSEHQYDEQGKSVSRTIFAMPSGVPVSKN